MYKVYHVFTDTGEWACTEQEILCAAYHCFNTKVSTKTTEEKTVTLCDRNNAIIKRKTL